MAEVRLWCYKEEDHARTAAGGRAAVENRKEAV